MTPKPIRLLVLEDNAVDAELIVRELRRAGFAPDWERVETEADYLARLDRHPDLILSDYSLPQYNGTRAVEQLRERGLDIPFILISGSVGEEKAVVAMKAGADDYLLKDRLGRLGSAVEQALKTRQLRAERKQTEEALRHSEQLYRSLVESLPQSIFRKDLAGRFTFVNRRFCLTLGRKITEVIGRTDADLFPPGLAAKYRADDQQVMESGLPLELEEQVTDRQGETFHVQVSKSPVLDAAGNVIGIQGVFTDITARKQAEEVLRKRAAELEKFHRLSVGRELGMVELKKEVNELSRLAGKEAPYKLAFLGEVPTPSSKTTQDHTTPTELNRR